MNHEKFARSFSHDICHLWPTVLKELFCLWRLLSCPVTGVTGASVFKDYSPVLALASLGLERFCEKDSAILKKRALTFTLSLGILAKSLMSLKLLSCPGICGTGTKVDWPGKKGALSFQSHLAFWQTPFCYSVFDDYSPVLAFVALELLSLKTTLLSWH